MRSDPGGRRGVPASGRARRHRYRVAAAVGHERPAARAPVLPRADRSRGRRRLLAGRRPVRWLRWRRVADPGRALRRPRGVLMAVIVTVTLNRPEIYALLTDRVRRIGNRVQNVARRRAPKDTGALAASLHTVVGAAPGFVFADIGSNLDYALWQHEGTGIYAGQGYIRPKRARVMRFKPGRKIGPVRGSGKFSRGRRQTGGFVYAHKVKGTPPNPYLVSALFSVVGGS